MAMSEGDPRKARAGKNQSPFRDVNERIEESTEDCGEELDPTKGSTSSASARTLIASS